MYVGGGLFLYGVLAFFDQQNAKSDSRMWPSDQSDAFVRSFAGTRTELFFFCAPQRAQTVSQSVSQDEVRSVQVSK